MYVPWKLDHAIDAVDKAVNNQCPVPTRKVVKDAGYVKLPCLELSFDDAVIVLDLSEKPTGHSRQVTFFCSDCDAVHPWRLAVFDQTCTEKCLPGCKVFATGVQALSILDSMYHVLKQQIGSARSAPCKPCMVKLDWPRRQSCLWTGCSRALCSSVSMQTMIWCCAQQGLVIMDVLAPFNTVWCDPLISSIC